MVTSKKVFAIKSQPGFGLIAATVFVMLYLPIIVLVIFAFNATSSMGVWGGFSLRWFEMAWQNEKIIAAAQTSVYVAAIAGLTATTMATMAAIAMTRTAPYRGMTFKFAILNQPLMVPEIVTAIALLIVFAQIRVWTGYSGPAYLILAHSAFCIPFAYLPIRARLEGMDLTLETAASDLYAGPWQTFRHVTLPNMWPGILAGFMLAFVVSLDDVVITELVKSAGQETLPTYMLGQLRRDMTPEVNAAAASLLLLSVLLITVFYIISRKKK
jgi:spermidine/putrescine transport system permease protein